MPKIIPTAIPHETDAQYVARCESLGISLEALDDFFEAELPPDDGDSEITVSTHYEKSPIKHKTKGSVHLIAQKRREHLSK